MVTSWQAALLLALLGVAASLVVAILICSWWHGRQAARTARLERMVQEMLPKWFEWGPSTTELEWLTGLSRTEGAAVVGRCASVVPTLAVDAAERVRSALRLAGLLERELTRLRHRAPLQRAQACRNLGRLGLAEAVPALVERLRDPDSAVRRHAIGALADLRAVGALGAVIETIERTADWGNLLALMALIRMGPGSASQLGALLAGSRSPAMTKALLQVTGRLGVAADPAVVRALAADPDPEIRVEAVRALGSLPPDAASVTVCLAAMDDPAWPPRALAAWSLGRLRDARAIPRLEQAMGDSAYWVRHHVAEALAALGNPGAEALRRGLDHANPFVRDMAAQTLFMRALQRRERA